MNNQFLTSAEWLNDNIDNESLKIVEAPWKQDSYNRAHIKGARCLSRHSYLKSEDANGNRSVHVCDESEFKTLLADLGISDGDEVVVYDDFHGLFSGRFWWVCAYYGFSNVKILNGGWHAWFEKRYPISIETPQYTSSTNFEPKPNNKMLIGLDELKDRVYSDSISIWDARRPEEFNGAEETSNKRKGHIPNARNIEWKNMLQEEKCEGGPRYFKSNDEMEQILIDAGLNKDKEIVTHCQASIRGAVGSFVLEMLGYSKHRLYDAAMAEWSNLDDTPLEID